MAEETILEIVKKELPNYDNLGKNTVQAISLLLDKNKIKYISVDYRIKTIESFLEKIERKSYEDPLNEMEDICGVRIICYYQSDIEKICEIISKEFLVHTSEDKEENLQPDQFGYRSHHFIASIKKEWAEVPNYRELINLKTEIQVRTILMHAWAEIEHNLAYKKQNHIPEKFKRKLFRISAKLEEADEQFEDLKKESVANQNDLIKKAKDKTLLFDNSTEVNIDTLQAFLDFLLPKRKKKIDSTASLLDEIIKYNFKYGDIKNAYEKLKGYLPELEKEAFKSNSLYSKWAQVGVIRTILDIAYPEYNKRNDPARKAIRDEWRKKYFA